MKQCLEVTIASMSWLLLVLGSLQLGVVAIVLASMYDGHDHALHVCIYTASSHRNKLRSIATGVCLYEGLADLSD